MKKLAVICLVLFAACKAVDSSDNLFVIPSYSGDQKTPIDDTTTVHKAGDVEVFRMLGADTLYIARLYRIDAGEVRQYQTWIMENVLYDKARYQWMNDSTVAFQLVDTKNKKIKRFNLTGSGASTSVWED